MRGIKAQKGFSLIELLLATLILTIVIMMSSNLFTIVIAQSGQQARVANSGMESVIALSMLRYDIAHAGFGLPEQFQDTITYSEAASGNYNDSPGVPRAIIADNNAGYNDSDRLIIKSTVAGISDTAQKWTYNGSDLGDEARVVAIRAKSGQTPFNTLVVKSGAGAEKFTFKKDSLPTAEPGRLIIYGVADSDLRMPFNRAEYYVSRPATGMSPSCAPHTGMLHKATVRHSNGSLNEMPIMDCVADMQVFFRRDTNSDGVADTPSNDLSGLTAQQIRETVKEVRVYILAQEGQIDRSYIHTPSTVLVGEDFGGTLWGKNFDLAATIGTGWNHYRWKVYTIVVNPKQFQP